MQPPSGGPSPTDVPNKPRKGRPKATDFYYCGIYLVFLIVLTFVLFGMTNRNGYYMSKIVLDRFVSVVTLTRKVRVPFKELYNAEDMYTYLQVTFLEAVNKKTGPRNRASRQQGAMFISDDMMLIGVPRMRHLKVAKSKCRLSGHLLKFFRDCYGEYEQKLEDRDTETIDKGLDFHYVLMTRKTEFDGKLAVYGGNGNVVEFNSTIESSKKILKKALAPGLMEFGTRAFFIELSSYSRAVQLLLIAQIVFERSAAGGITPSYRLVVTALFGTEDYIFLGTLVVYLLIALVEFVYRLVRTYPRCTNFWNIYDLMLMVLVVINFLYGILNWVEKEQVETWATLPDDYHDMASLAAAAQAYSNFQGMLLFAMYLKLMKYMRCSFSLLAIKESFFIATVELSSYAMVFCICFIGFGLLARNLFGDTIMDYRTVWDSMASLARIFVGDFKYTEMDLKEPIMASTFLMLYTFVVVLTLSNVFLAILINAYTQVRTEGTFVVPSTQHRLSKFENLMIKMRGKDHIDCWRTVLKRAHFTVESRKEIMKKHSLKPCDAFDVTKFAQIMEYEKLNYSCDEEGVGMRRAIDTGIYRMVFLKSGINEVYINTKVMNKQMLQLLKPPADESEELGEEEAKPKSLGAVKSKRFPTDPNATEDDEEEVKTMLPCGPSCYTIGQVGQIILDRDRPRVHHGYQNCQIRMGHQSRLEAEEKKNKRRDKGEPSPNFPRTNLPIKGHSPDHVIYKTIRLKDVRKGRYLRSNQTPSPIRKTQAKAHKTGRGDQV